MFPMMQFSLAPWRMLDDIHLEAVSDAAALHTQMAGRILELAQESARTGEPILRSLEFMYPGQVSCVYSIGHQKVCTHCTGWD